MFHTLKSYISEKKLIINSLIKIVTLLHQALPSIEYSLHFQCTILKLLCLLVHYGSANGFCDDIHWANEIKINVCYMSYHNENQKHVDAGISNREKNSSSLSKNVEPSPRFIELANSVEIHDAAETEVYYGSSTLLPPLLSVAIFASTMFKHNLMVKLMLHGSEGVDSSSLVIEKIGLNANHHFVS